MQLADRAESRCTQEALVQPLLCLLAALLDWLLSVPCLHSVCFTFSYIYKKLKKKFFINYGAPYVPS